LLIEELGSTCHRSNGGIALKNFVRHSTEKQNRMSSDFGDINIVAPALSLSHPDRVRSLDGFETRKQAADHAISLLARSTQSRDTKELGQVLLSNLYESFCVLVDSRLRAHVCFMAKKGLQSDRGDVCELERRIQDVWRLGGRVCAEKIVTAFEPLDTAFEIENNTFQTPLQLSVRMDLGLASLNANNDKVYSAVRFAAPGDLTGRVVKKTLSKIYLRLNLQHLLDDMMKQASQVVMTVVETVELSQRKNEKDIKRGNSFLAMPPPKPKKPRFDPVASPLCGGLDLLSHTAAVLPIVSPDMSAKKATANVIPDLELENEDVMSLSADQCADIVDGVFGEEFDDTILVSPISAVTDKNR
jgi:hypothetical protein